MSTVFIVALVHVTRACRPRNDGWLDFRVGLTMRAYIIWAVRGSWCRYAAQ